KITYKKSGVDYSKIDPIKKLAQISAKKTSKNFKNGFSEVADSRGESAFVWKVGNYYMALVSEGLGTKSLVADGVYKETKKSYYENIAYDTVATIINDLVSVGATPLVLNAYWADSGSGFLHDKKKMQDFIKGWKKACDLSGVVWGGGETPTLSGIIEKNATDLGGSAVGIIRNKRHLITDKKLRDGDRIILIKSNGVNDNGISLARAIAKKLPKGYGTKLPNGKSFGESLLTKSNIYAKVISDLQKANIDIHYISNITGHGLRKIMRGRPSFAYALEKIFKPHGIFDFIAEQAGLNPYEMYQTYDMGQDYAIFVRPKDVLKTLKIIRKNKLRGMDAGFVQKGKKQLVIKPINVIFSGETLDLR
ncbi:MAG: AIR synthase related protein, partial [Patescibacteria group bacterium]